MPPNTLYGGCLRERGRAVVMGQLARSCLSCMNMKYAKKNESNIVALPLAQFNVASRWVVSSSHAFFFLGKPYIRWGTGKHSDYPLHPHIHGITYTGLLTFILCWIFYIIQLFLATVWRIISGFSSGCSSGRMGAWRSSTWREQMKAGTPASQKMTGARPTARALCWLQASSS